jgi:glycine hydroxymethyltransferase
MSTTHKSLDGPRGAVLLTTEAAIAKKLDRAVFPGEQGGPHVNVFAGLALAFKLAQTEQFKQAASPDDQERGRHGRPVPETRAGRPLRRHRHAPDQHRLQHHQGRGWHRLERRLRFAHPGYRRRGGQPQHHPRRQIRLDPSGLRLGTPWITQRGFDEAKSRRLADIIADVLLACAPFSVDTPRKGRQRRAKIDFQTLNEAKLKIRDAGAWKPAWTSNRASTAIPISITWTTKPRRVSSN